MLKIQQLVIRQFITRKQCCQIVMGKQLITSRICTERHWFFLKILYVLNHFICFAYHNKEPIFFRNLTKETTQKSGDSGGAKPKIREQDTPTTSSNAYSSDSTNSDRLEASTSGVNTEQKSNDEESSANAAFECNICLDVARDAVISMCGHLFCWPCLHTWLETRPNRQICPVCKAGIGKDKVVPLYGRGKSSLINILGHDSNTHQNKT